MIKIIAGKKKRTSIIVPKNIVRPTTAQKREAIFSVIESYGLKKNLNIYKNSIILDLFAGSGILGLEAISRGADFVYFFEKNIEVIKCLKKNCLKICNNNYIISNEDITKSNFSTINKKISLIFIDPPYNINPFKNLFINIKKSKILKKNTLIIIESSINLKLDCPIFLDCLKVKKYKKTKITFLINKNI